MNKRLILRILLGLSVALITGFVTTATSQAESAAQTALPSDCNECHASVQTHWENSDHAVAFSDAVFQAAWLNEGQPSECMACHTTGYDAETGTWEAEGITCDACHQLGPHSTHHPEQVMPTDVSSRLCGQCHLDTYAEWESSEHGKGDLTCNKCHNPHTTSLKKDPIQDLCIGCHNEESHFFNYTAHAQEGLLCTDCHLRIHDGDMGDGHGKREHTFAVDLHTCNQCHKEEMHAITMPQPAAILQPTGDTTIPADCMQAIPVILTNDTGSTIVNAEPPANKQSFNLLLSAGLGLLFGVVIAPWMERWYQGRKNS